MELYTVQAEYLADVIWQMKLEIKIGKENRQRKSANRLLLYLSYYTLQWYLSIANTLGPVLFG